jgi:murein DD-endopeptidase / murein LD-carboxypeptidase
MTTLGAKVARDVEAAALALVGVRFRLHGRDRSGLDCVGLAALAAGVAVPSGYGLRGGRAAEIAVLIDATGLARVTKAAPGDVMLMRAGPAQLHLGVRTARGFVHADAGLRRVVERPGEPEWEVLGLWRRLS